jgi:Putative peptidoglycan binding domain/Trypsin-like peptidase domain
MAQDAATLPLTPIAVFGADDRVPLPARYAREQNTIGLLIDMRTRSVCTAFCVGEAMIATAGHCLFKTAGERKPRLLDFWFARNYDQVRDLTRIAGHDTGAAAQNVLAGSMALKVSPPIDASSDWALVRLARPACTGVLALRAMPAEEAVREAREGRVFQIAYHRDFTLWRQAYSKPCQVERSFPGVEWKTIAADFKAPDAILLHTCDTGGASSGSPVFVETGRGPQVIGVNIGTYVQSRIIAREGKPSAGSTLSRPEPVANTAVGVAGFIDRIAPFKAANIIGTAAGIRELQEALKARGHYDGAIDGSYGSGLQRAIEAYELASAMPVTGVASQVLKDRLKAGR